MKPRKIEEVVRDLRSNLGLTQQAFASAMESAVSTVVRYEHGFRPSVQSLAKMVGLARGKGLEHLAAELQTHLNVGLGPNFPLSPDPNEQICVLLARRLNQNPKRRDDFFKFAAQELEQLKAENQLRKEQSADFWAALDAWSKRQKSGKS